MSPASGRFFPGDAERRQREYYTRTASQYDSAHAGGDHGGDEWLPTLGALLAAERVGTLLDVGCATGARAAKLAGPELRVVGLDPVAALMAQGSQAGISFVGGSAYGLPFPGASFDAVLEMGALHHVRRPDLAVREMTRVARRVVVLADANRFGQGRLPVRVAKLLLWKARLGPAVETLRTRGAGYHYSEGDGVFFSYSVFDSLPVLAGWADRVYALSLHPPARLGLFHPLLTSPSVALVAIRPEV